MRHVSFLSNCRQYISPRYDADEFLLLIHRQSLDLLSVHNTIDFANVRLRACGQHLGGHDVTHTIAHPALEEGPPAYASLLNWRLVNM